MFVPYTHARVGLLFTSTYSRHDMDFLLILDSFIVPKEKPPFKGNSYDKKRLMETEVEKQIVRLKGNNLFHTMGHKQVPGPILMLA